MVRGLESLMGRATHREAECTREMAKILVYKEIAVENRVRREERYANRREMDAQEAVDRDTAVAELLFAKYNDDWEILARQKSQRMRACHAARQHENQLVAGLMVHEIVALAMVVAGKREDSIHSRDATAFLPTDASWNELRYQFAQHGVTALSESSVGEDNLLHHELVAYLEQFILPPFGTSNHDYVGAVTRGSSVSPWVPCDWKFVAAVDIVEDRFVLGETVKYLRWLAHADPPPVPVPSERRVDREDVVPAGVDSPPSPAVEEEPLAEATESESNDVETASGVAVIDALREAEPTADSESLLPSETIAPDPESIELLPRLCILLVGPPFAGKTTQARRLADKYNLALLSVEKRLHEALSEPSELGLEAQTALVRGDQIPPSIYSRLVLAAIEQLDPQHRNRWVLYDLPSTLAHAQSLEEHLTAFVEPSQILSPFDYASLLAPGCAKPPLPKSLLHGKSGLDLVFYLDCGEASVLERCLGTLEDSATHEQTYHLLFAPPPVDATDRHRLQHVNATSNASALLSLQCLSTQDLEADAKSWFRRFDTLREIATTECQQGVSVAITRALTADATHERLVAHVEAFVDQQRMAAIEHGREKEREEAIAMQEEEVRQERLTDLKARLRAAQDEVARAKESVQHAEDNKAKKEDIAELRGAVESAKKLVEQVLVDARDWRCDESLKVRHAQTVYSAKLVPSLARVLASLWEAIESEYTQTMKQCVRLQRQQRDLVDQRVLWVVATVCRFLRRVDAKQQIVDTFQTQFNAVLEDMRFDEATKCELHARVDVLQEALCATTTTKKLESDDVLREIVGDGWLEDTCQWIAVVYQRMLQAECDRFRGSLQLLVDAFAAASDEPLQLTAVNDALKTHPHVLAELTLRVFADTSEDAVEGAVGVPTPGAATGKGSTAKPSGAAVKGKPPLASTPAVDDGVGGGDPLAPETLLLSFDLVLQKSDALVKLVTNAKPAEPAVPVAPPAQPTAPHGKATGKTGASPAATPTATPVSSVALLPRQTIDVATSNFHKAVQYERDLLVRRVHFLKEAVQSACDHVTRAMRSVEATLRDAIEQRALREEAAVAALVAHIRTAIEAETNLPFYLHIQPEQVDRFPVTQHLIEDTRVTVDATQRLVARAPVDPPPTIEWTDPLRLNARQACELRRRLLVEEVLEEPPVNTLTIVDVVSVLLTLATEPHALPTLWEDAEEFTLAQVVAAFADSPSGLVDTGKLVQAMETGTAPLLLPPLRKQDDNAPEEDVADGTGDA